MQLARVLKSHPPTKNRVPISPEPTSKALLKILKHISGSSAFFDSLKNSKTKERI